MKKYNVVRAKKYTSNNEEKTMWLQVGVITQFDNGSQILELNDRSETYQIFEMKKPNGNGINEVRKDDVEPVNIPF